jgi:hypothetical protein
MTARMYSEMERTLKAISRRQGQYSHFDNNIVSAIKRGMEKFNDYRLLMEGNDIYYIALVLDPRIKTQWIKDYCDEPDKIIDRIRKFLKATYPPDIDLPPNEENKVY